MILIDGVVHGVKVFYWSDTGPVQVRLQDGLVVSAGCVSPEPSPSSWWAEGATMAEARAVEK